MSSDVEAIHAKIATVAEGQKEMMERIREVQFAVNNTFSLLREQGPGHGQGNHQGPREGLGTGSHGLVAKRGTWCSEQATSSMPLMGRKGTLLSDQGTNSRGVSSKSSLPLGINRVASLASNTSAKVGQRRSDALQSIIESEHLLAMQEDIFDQPSDAFHNNCSMLPPDWPMSIQLRMALRKKPSNIATRAGDMMIAGSTAVPKRASDLLIGALVDRSGPWRMLIGPWNPHSIGNMLFDCLGLVVLTYDLGSTTVQLAWDILVSGPFFLCSCISVAYWTISMLVACRTGFYERGELKMDDKEIALHYLSRYFLFDMFVIVVDWICVITLDTSGALGILRIFRLLKIARLLKVFTIFNKLSKPTGGSESSGLVLLKVGGFTLIFTHMMCCAWYAIGTIQSTDTGNHWTDDFHGQDIPSYLYFVAYHWVLSQITLGSHDVSPTSSHERVFCIALSIFGLLYSSCIVSIISAKAMEYVTTRRERVEDMTRLSTFLEQHRVELRMANRVRRQANDRLMSSSVMLSEDGVKALSLLSTDLHSELLYEVRSPHVGTHPLFQVWAFIEAGALRRLCQEAVCFLTAMPQDCVFMAGESGSVCFYVTPLKTGGMSSKSTLFLSSSPLLYTQSPDSSFVESPTTVTVKEGSWISEGALWTEWFYVGKLTARYVCQLLTVDAAKLQGTLGVFAHVADSTRMYAGEYIMRLRAASPPFSSWPNDLQVPGADPGNLLSGQAYCSLLHSEWMAGNLNISQQAYEELLEEVNNEKSAIICGPDQDLQRVVFICALQIQRTDGHLFVQVGKWSEKKGPEPAGAVLPGTKRDRGELPHKALRRLLLMGLQGLQEGIVLSNAVEEAEYKESEKYGMMTKYLRTVNFAEWKEDFEMPHLPVARLLPETPSGVDYQIDDLPSYCNTDVYVVHTKEDKADLYAWIPEDDLDMVRGPELDVLKSWMLSLDPKSCKQGSAGTLSPAFHSAEDLLVAEDEQDIGLEDFTKQRGFVRASTWSQDGVSMGKAFGNKEVRDLVEAATEGVLLPRVSAGALLNASESSAGSGPGISRLNAAEGLRSMIDSEGSA